MLNPNQTDKLQHLLGDEVMLKIIEQVFNETLDNNLPTIGPIDDNKVIGEKYRAYEQAKGIVRTAFLDLLSFKQEVEQNKEVVNRGK